MRFLIDECLHESLVELARAAGFDATHVSHLGLSGAPDWALAQRTVKDDFTFVTNNRADFIHLYRKMDLHAGLVVLVPNVVPDLQRALFQAALQYSAARDLINTVIEMRLEGKTVQCGSTNCPRRRAPAATAGPPLQENRYMKPAVPDEWIKRAFFGDIHSSAQFFFQVDQRSTGDQGVRGPALIGKSRSLSLRASPTQRNRTHAQRLDRIPIRRVTRAGRPAIRHNEARARPFPSS